MQPVAVLTDASAPPPTSMQKPILVVGASSRAAAFSLRRAGFQTQTIDCFADADLQAVCHARRVRDYPRGLVTAAGEMPDGPWMYVGALENHPDVVAELSRARELLGNRADVLRRVRDPWQLADAVRATGVRYPETRRIDDAPLTGDWLVKPLRSAAGIGVRRWEPGRSPSSRTHYLQARVGGLPASAVYVGAGGKATLLGASEQLVGLQWAGAEGFQYCGSVSLPLTDHLLAILDRLGVHLAEVFDLCGLFGVDFMLDGDEVWVIEVNPRYTASVEVLELASEAAAMSAHVSACREKVLPGSVTRPTTFAGKVVIYSRRSVTVTTAAHQELMRLSKGVDRQLADIPHAGTQVRAGDPVVCGLVTASSRPDVLRLLREQTALVQSIVAC